MGAILLIQNQEYLFIDVNFDSESNDYRADIEQIKQNDLLKEISQQFNLHGMNFLNCVENLPYFKSNRNLTEDIYQYDNSEKLGVRVPLAALLGLPNIKPHKELQELGKLLQYFFEQAVENPSQKICINLERGIESNLYISCLNQDRNKELQSTFDLMIDSSVALTTWKKNQLEAIKNTAEHCEDLLSTTNFGKFLDIDEQSTYFNLSEKRLKMGNLGKKLA